MSLESVLIRRLIWNVVPAAMVVGALWAALAGEHGLLNRHKLKSRLAATEAAVEVQIAENERQEAKIVALREDPVALRREAARVLLQAEPGATLYRLEGVER